MLVKFTEITTVDPNSYYAIFDGTSEEACGVILGELVLEEEYQERYKDYYLSAMRLPKTPEDLVKCL